MGYNPWRPYADDEEQQPFVPDMTFTLEETERGRTPPPMAAPAGPPMRGSLSSLIQPRDAEMDSRWRAAEQSALDRSGYAGDQSYGFGEAVRDFAPMAVGGVLDVLLNKGKGLGYLAGAGMQANAQTAATRQKEAAAAGDFAAQARNQRESQQGSGLDAAYKQAQIERWNDEAQRGWANIGERQKRQLFQEAKAAWERDPNDPQAQAMRQTVLELTGVDVGALGTQNQGRMMGVVGREQSLQNAGPMQDARNASDLRYAGPTSAARAVGTEEGKNQAAPITANTNEQLGNVTERTSKDEAFATQFSKDNEAAIKAGVAVGNILKLSKDGQPAPGLDPAHRLGSKIPGATQLLPNEFPQNVQTVLQNLDFAEEAYSRDQSGAAIGVKEAAKFLRQVIGSPLASAQDVQAAIQRFSEQNNAYLRARSAANPNAAAKVLGAAGMDIGSGGQQPQASGPAAPPMKQYPTAQTTVTQGAPPAAGGDIELQPSGMPDGSFYAIDKATGRRKRVSAQTAAQIRGGQ